jgi:hypothetical protein
MRTFFLVFLNPLLPVLAIGLLHYVNDRERNLRLHPAFEDEATALLLASAVILLILGVLLHRRRAALMLTPISLGIAFFGFLSGTIGVD